ncbi:MAG TPA: cupin domain-containing protein [Burkholderiales bacterium]|nr:cupin domain-containing protein [Burkholderiales bacterium]
MRSRLLGDRTPREFLRHYWQKRPLFVRRALPGFAGVVTEETLARLATRGDVESRIVERRGARRETRHGPFTEVTARASGWTLLVNGVNLHVDGAHALLQRFSFVPQARLDDVMVSYATPGGGVGPHVDFYDVFLLQGPGRRAWRVENKRFVAEAGDLLYLPPGVRHDGVALERCFTYSIGFRAPRGAELGAAFLDWLHERGLPQAEYRDPRLAPASHPGRIPAALIVFAQSVLARIRWSQQDLERFLGEYLSEPKPYVVFKPRPAGRLIARSRVRLDRKTRLLYRGRRFYINGESLAVKRSSMPILRELADRRAAEGARLAGAGLAGLISKWHRLGYLTVEKA